MRLGMPACTALQQPLPEEDSAGPESHLPSCRRERLRARPIRAASLEILQCTVLPRAPLLE